MSAETSVPATALLMCAGLGTRIRSLTEDKLPKHLLKVGGKPLVEHSLEPFLDANVQSIYLLLSHKAHMIIKHFAGDQRIRTFVVDEADGVISEVRQFVRYIHPQDLIIAEGDSIRHGLDLRKAWDQHVATGANTTLVATNGPLENTQAYHGVIVDQNRQVLHVHEPNEPTPNPNPMLGLGIFSQAAINTITSESLEKTGSWSTFLPYLFALGKTYASIQPVRYFNINSPQEFTGAEDFLERNKLN